MVCTCSIISSTFLARCSGTGGFFMRLRKYASRNKAAIFTPWASATALICSNCFLLNRTRQYSIRFFFVGM